MKIKSIILSIITILVLGGCYLFAPLDTVESIRIEPRIIELREGEQEIANIKIEPPEQEGRVEITLETDKPEILEYYGTNQDIIVTGYVRGIGKIIATTPDGKKAEAIVNITGYTEGGEDKYITSRYRLIQAIQGETLLLSASLVGGTDIENEQMQWRIVDTTMGRLVSAGTTALLECYRDGQTQIQISHPEAESTYIIDLLVAPDTTRLTLSSYILEMRINEYEEIAAILENENTPTAIDGLVWQMVVPDGETAIAEIIGTGEKVTINALRVGTQYLAAMLPNGSRAYCQIKISEEASLHVSQQDVRLRPGQTWLISYENTPDTDAVDIMNSNPQAVNVIHDIEDKKITIIAVEEGTATVALTTTSKAKSVVYCQVAWPKEIVIESPYLQIAPGTTEVIKYSVSPPGTNVSIRSTDTTIATATCNQTDKEISVTGLKEGSVSVEVIGTNGITEYLFMDYVIQDWSVKLIGFNVTSPYKTRQGIFGNEIWVGDGGILGIRVVPLTPGLVYTVSFIPSGGMDEGRITFSMLPDGITCNIAYVPAWTLKTDWHVYGVMTITTTQPSTGESQTATYNVIGNFYAW